MSLYFDSVDWRELQKFFERRSDLVRLMKVIFVAEWRMDWRKDYL